MTQVSEFEVRDRVAYITLNRPKAMNALNPDLRWALSQHFDEVESNDDIWMAVITGAGDRAFSAGADLKHRAIERDVRRTVTWNRFLTENPSAALAKFKGKLVEGESTFDRELKRIIPLYRIAPAIREIGTVEFNDYQIIGQITSIAEQSKH